MTTNPRPPLHTRLLPHGYDPVSLPATVFVFIMILTGAVFNGAFLSGTNISNVLIQITPLLVVSFGQLIVVGTGGLDLSIGSVVSLVAVTTAVAMPHTEPALAIVLGIVAGTAAGALNGLMVSFGLESFLVTLATLSLFQGAAFLISPVPGGRVSPGFAQLAGSWHGVPYALILVIAVGVLVAVLLRLTRTGGDILAVGGHIQVARMLGISARRTLIKGYAAAGLLGSLGGLFMVARTRIGDPTIGASFTLDSLAVVVIGGASLLGGKVSVIGTVFGALALGLISNVMNLISIPSYYQTITKGVILIVAILIPAVLVAVASRSRRKKLAAQPLPS